MVVDLPKYRWKKKKIKEIIACFLLPNENFAKSKKRVLRYLKILKPLTPN